MPHRDLVTGATGRLRLALTVTLGLAWVNAAHADRTAIYLPGALRFSQNVNLKCPLATRDGEPSIRVDVRGNCYVSGIRGVPAGVDLWRFDLNPASPSFDPGMQQQTYLGQPDAFIPTDPNDPTTGGADGGGDIDIATSFPTHPDSVPVLTMSSLALANISSAISTDRGVNFLLSPATALVPADDRQWIEADGPNAVYLLYRAPIPATPLYVQRSDDHGLTFLNPALLSTGGTSPGYIDVDHNNGNVYAAHQSSGLGRVSRSTDGGANWTTVTVDATTGHGELFDVVKVGDDGTVYLVWTDGQDIYLSHSINGGINWAQKVRVNDNAAYQTNLMPWIEAGSDGRVCVVWYGTTHAGNDDNADWSVLFSQSLDAKSLTPTFRQQVISDHIIHGSNISTGGLTGGANRNLIDYFQVALDPQGAAVVAFTDDHNDFDGHTWVTRQLDGTSLYAGANGGTGIVTPAFPPPLPTQDFSLPEVTDFLHDATTGLLQPIPVDNPYDILWIDYACEDAGGNPMLVVTMKLSGLAAAPGTQWRANFVANAPGTAPGVPGVSDNGQQFFVRAGVDTQSAQTFQWGTATRAGDGSTTYTDRGFCNFGMFDLLNGTITMKVALSQLNPYANPDIAAGSVLCGLRGQSLEPGFEGPPGNRHPLRDHTLGGGTYTFGACGITATLLVTFHAEDAAEGIRVVWGFSPEARFTEVRLERAERAAGPWSIVDSGPTVMGTTSTLDRGAAPGGHHFYRLVATEAGGSPQTFGPIEVNRVVTSDFLGGAHPNPAVRNAEVSFQIARSGFVDLAVFDPRGRRVRTLHAGALAPGRYTRSWDGSTDRFSQKAPAGIYFFVLNTAEGVKSQRVALVR